jgi:hypothetical protein
MGAIMQMNFFIGISGNLPRADKSAVCTINRHLHCHAEPFAAAQGTLREGSVALGSEMLRGVYPERSECAQHDRAGTPTNAWINLFMCIIGPYSCPAYFVKLA